MKKTGILIFSSVIVANQHLYALTVKDVCPGSKFVTDARNFDTVLSRFPDGQGCGLGDDTAVDKLNSQIIQALLKGQAEANKKNKGGEASLMMKLMEGRDETLPLLEQLAKLVQDNRFKTTPPSDPDVKSIMAVNEEFKSAIAKFDKKQISEDDLRKSEKAYVESLKKVMRKTSQGRAALKCFENPSEEIKSKLPGNAMPEFRLTNVLSRLSSNNSESSVGGSFSISCTHTNPPKFDPQISLNPDDFQPMQMVIEMTHEMSHTCDAASMMENNLEQKIRSEGEINFTGNEKLKPVMDMLGIKSMPELQKMRNFLGWTQQKELGLSNPGPRDEATVKREKEYEQTLSLIKNSGIQVSELKTFMEKLRSDNDLADKKIHFDIALSELKAFKTATEMFKELAQLDPAYCGMTDVTYSSYGPQILTRADLYRTYDEGSIVDEIMILYSLKNHAIGENYIFKRNPPQRNQTGSSTVYDTIKLDEKGRPIYQEDFLEYLRKAGFKP